MSVSKCEKGLWNVSRGFFLSYRPLREPNWYFTIFIAGKNILKFLIRYYIKLILNADLKIILYSPWDFSIRFHSFFLWKLAFEWLTKSDKNDHKTAPTEAFLIRTAGREYLMSKIAPSVPVLFGGFVLIVWIRSLVMNKWFSVLLTNDISISIFDLLFKEFSFNFVNLKKMRQRKIFPLKGLSPQIQTRIWSHFPGN